MKSILDPSFQYTSSFNTDLRKTFARIRRDRLQGSDVRTKEGPPRTPKVARVRHLHWSRRAARVTRTPPQTGTRHP